MTGVVAALPTVTNQVRDGVVDKVQVMGINFTSPGVGDRLKKTVTSASGSTTADQGMLFISTTGELSGSGSITNFTLVNMVGSNSGNFVNSSTRRRAGLEDNLAVKFIAPVFGGWDGYDPRSNLLTDLNDGTVSGDFDVARKTLANPEEVDFNLLAVPGVTSSGAGTPINNFLNMVESRADAFLLVDIANSTATGAGLGMTVTQAQTEADKFDSSYGATYYPWVKIQDRNTAKPVFVPPSVMLPGVIAFNDQVAF